MSISVPSESEKDLKDLGILLDHLDDAQKHLRGGTQIKEVTESFPRFVICGPQSSGKSAILSRFSGITFPQAKGRCTRIAAQLILRRDPTVFHKCTIKLVSFDDSETPPPVTFSSGTEEEHTAKLPEIQAKIAELQDSFPGDGFVDTHEIEIRVQSNQEVFPNVTLMDLPGFTEQGKPEETKQVDEMVEKYLKMEGTLILHVFRADVDYGSLKGNNMVSQYKERSTSVLTHADVLDTDKADKMFQQKQEYLEGIVEQTKNRFVVLGIEKEDEAKYLESLKVFEDLRDEFHFGRNELVVHVMEKVRAHVTKQVPGLIQSLKSALRHTEEELEKYQLLDGNPHQYLMKIESELKQKFSEQEDVLRTKLWREIRSLRAQIMDARLRPTAGKYNYRYLEKDEVLEVGCKARVVHGTEWVWGVVAEVDSAKNHTISYTHEGEKRTTVIVNTEIGIPEATQGDITTEILLEAQKLSEKSLKNLTHTDEHIHIARYATDFATRYAKILREHSKSIRKQVDACFEDTFECSGDDMAQAQDIIAYLRKKIKKEVLQIDENLAQTITKLEQFNSHDYLISTSNDHYLNANYVEHVKDMKSGATDEVAADLIYFKVRAYLQTQSKFIIESAHKEFLYAYDGQVREAFKQVLELIGKKGTPQASELPAKQKLRKERLERTAQALKKALAALDSDE